MPNRGGLVNVFLCLWQLAKDAFESALQLEPANTTLKNNIAVCTFYQGYLKEVSVSASLAYSSTKQWCYYWSPSNKALPTYGKEREEIQFDN